MSVKFNIVERGNPSNPAAPRKYYPSITASGRLSLRQVMQRISQVSSVSSADTAAVIEAFLAVIPHELAAGNVVELGDFGNFWLKANATGAGSPGAVRAGQITTLLPRFNPGREFRKALETIEFERA
jgi:predicted histone-like DNA-binding protein